MPTHHALRRIGCHCAGYSACVRAHDDLSVGPVKPASTPECDRAVLDVSESVSLAEFRKGVPVETGLESWVEFDWKCRLEDTKTASSSE